MATGIVKQLFGSDLVDFEKDKGLKVFPITTARGVYMSNGQTLEAYLALMNLNIENAGGGSGNGVTYMTGTGTVMAFRGATDEAAALANLDRSSTDIPPNGWYSSSNVTLGSNLKLFMTTALMSNKTLIPWTSGADAGYIWSTPILIGTGSSTSETGADNGVYNYVYCRTTTYEAGPPDVTIISVTAVEAARAEGKGINAENGLKTSLDTDNVNIWTDHPLGVTSVAQCEWIYIYVGEVSYMDKPVLWSKWGERGLDGDGVEYVFSTDRLLVLCDESGNESASGAYFCGTVGTDTTEYTFNKNTYMDSNSPYLKDDFIPKGWSDEPVEVNATQDKQYVSIRKKVLKEDSDTLKLWGLFSTPKLWSTFGSGITGSSSIMIFGKGPSTGFTTEEIAALRSCEKIPENWERYPDSITDLTSSDYVYAMTGTELEGNFLVIETASGVNYYWSKPFRVSGVPGSSVVADSSGIKCIFCRKSFVWNENVYKPTFDALTFIDGMSSKSTGLWAYKQYSNSYELIELSVTSGYGSTASRLTYWTDSPLGVTKEYKYEYICFSYKIDGIWTDWTTPALWSNFGVDGKDGDGFEYIYLLSDLYYSDKVLSNDDADSNPILNFSKGTFIAKGRNSNVDSYEKDDFLPAVPGETDLSPEYSWTDNPLSVSEDTPYLYMSSRTKSDNGSGLTWNSGSVGFKAPVLWTKFAKDGKVNDAYDLVSDNDVVIVDNDNIEGFPTLGEATFNLIKTSGDTTGFSAYYTVSTDSTLPERTDGVVALSVEIDSFTGKLTYKTKVTTGKLKVDNYAVRVNAYALDDNGTFTGSNGKKYTLVAYRKQIIQVKDFNSGESYKLIVTPNSISCDGNGYPKLGATLSVGYNVVPAKKTTNISYEESVTRIADFKKISALDAGSLFYTIEETKASGSLGLIDASTSNYQISTSTKITLDALIINLYYVYTDTLGNKTYTKVDSETVNVIKDGLSSTDKITSYELVCTTSCLIKNSTLYSPEKITFSFKQHEGSVTNVLSDALTIYVDGVKQENTVLSGLPITLGEETFAPETLILASIEKDSITYTADVPVVNIGEEQNLSGTIIRQSTWEVGKSYYNDSELTEPRDGEAAKYIDVVYVKEGAYNITVPSKIYIRSKYLSASSTYTAGTTYYTFINGLFILTSVTSELYSSKYGSLFTQLSGIGIEYLDLSKLIECSILNGNSFTALQSVTIDDIVVTNNINTEGALAGTYYLYKNTNSYYLFPPTASSGYISCTVTCTISFANYVGVKVSFVVTTRNSNDIESLYLNIINLPHADSSSEETKQYFNFNVTSLEKSNATSFYGLVYTVNSDGNPVQIFTATNTKSVVKDIVEDTVGESPLKSTILRLFTSTTGEFTFYPTKAYSYLKVILLENKGSYNAGVDAITSSDYYTEYHLSECNTDSSQNMYMCIKSHYPSDATNEPGTDGGKTYWLAMKQSEPIYTPLITADNMVFKVALGNNIYMMDADGNIIGGMTSYESYNQNDIRFFIGTKIATEGEATQTNIAEAPFRVYEDGSVVANNLQYAGWSIMKPNINIGTYLSSVLETHPEYFLTTTESPLCIVDSWCNTITDHPEKGYSMAYEVLSTVDNIKVIKPNKLGRISVLDNMNVLLPSYCMRLDPDDTMIYIPGINFLSYSLDELDLLKLTRYAEYMAYCRAMVGNTITIINKAENKASEDYAANFGNYIIGLLSRVDLENLSNNIQLYHCSNSGGGCTDILNFINGNETAHNAYIPSDYDLVVAEIFAGNKNADDNGTYPEGVDPTPIKINGCPGNKSYMYGDYSEDDYYYFGKGSSDALHKSFYIPINGVTTDTSTAYIYQLKCCHYILGTFDMVYWKVLSYTDLSAFDLNAAEYLYYFNSLANVNYNDDLFLDSITNTGVYSDPVTKYLS